MNRRFIYLCPPWHLPTVEAWSEAHAADDTQPCAPVPLDAGRMAPDVIDSRVVQMHVRDTAGKRSKQGLETTEGHMDDTTHMDKA